MIRSAFLGTPRSAVPTLEALARVSDLQLVITRPNRPRGRSKTPEASPVKSTARILGADVAQPADGAALATVLSGLDLDVAVVAAFGMIIPSDVLAMPTNGMVNVHYSLLPRWRGAAPVERAILAGDPTTGITLLQMEAGLDTGGILAHWETAIGADEAAGELTDRLAVAGAELLAHHLERIVAGHVAAEPQDEGASTYASMLSSAEARLDFTRPADFVVRMVRAFNPRPGAHTRWRGDRFKIHAARPVSGSRQPGQIETDGSVVLVGCGTGCLELLSVQPSGSKSMRASDWARGVRGDLGRFA